MNKNLLTRLKKNKKGFTLIELIVVIAILGILAAIAIPRFSGFQASAAKRAVEAEARTVASAVEAYNAEKNEWPANMTALSPYLSTSSAPGELNMTTPLDGTFTYTKAVNGKKYVATRTADGKITVADGVAQTPTSTPAN